MFLIWFFLYRLNLCFSICLHLYTCAILPGKAVPKMIYTVSGGTLNPTQSLAYFGSAEDFAVAFLVSKPVVSVDSFPVYCNMLIITVLLGHIYHFVGGTGPSRIVICYQTWT